MHGSMGRKSGAGRKLKLSITRVRLLIAQPAVFSCVLNSAFCVLLFPPDVIFRNEKNVYRDTWPLVAHMIESALVDAQTFLDIPQNFSVDQLSIDHAEILIQAGKTLGFVVAVTAVRRGNK